MSASFHEPALPQYKRPELSSPNHSIQANSEIEFQRPGIAKSWRNPRSFVKKTNRLGGPTKTKNSRSSPNLGGLVPSRPELLHSKSEEEQREHQINRSWTDGLLSKARSVMSIINYPRSVEHIFTRSTMWLIGREYPGIQDTTVPEEVLENAQQTRVERFREDFNSRIWITYRRDFPAIQNSSITSDTGWGCMVRSGQMLLAQAFLFHLESREWRYDPQTRSAMLYVQILRWFIDLPDPKCPYSIHNLLEAGQCFGKHVGTWFGPSETCHMIKECVTKHVLSSICVVVSNDGVLYLDQIEAACKWEEGTQLSTEGCSNSDQIEEKNEETIKRRNSDKKPTKRWRACILLVAVRLGLDRMNPDYIPHLKACLELPQSLGIMGGKPMSAYYFIGSQDDRLFYLDPHTTRRTTSLQRDLSIDSSEYHCDRICSMPAGDIDPSLAIGFYCQDKTSFDDFWERAQKFSALKLPIFTTADEQPNYDEDTAFDWSSESEFDPATAHPSSGPQTSSSILKCSDVSQTPPWILQRDNSIEKEDDGFVLV